MNPPLRGYVLHGHGGAIVGDGSTLILFHETRDIGHDFAGREMAKSLENLAQSPLSKQLTRLTPRFGNSIGEREQQIARLQSHPLRGQIVLSGKNSQCQAGGTELFPVSIIVQ